MRVAYKIWLDNNGKAFGEGPYKLLEGVEKTGSLHQAAQTMGMSYRKAWMTLKASEKRLGFILLDRRVGGVAGGGSHITDEAKVFMNNYNKFREEARKELEMLYGKYFGERE